MKYHLCVSDALPLAAELEATSDACSQDELELATALQMAAEMIRHLHTLLMDSATERVEQ